MLKFTRTRLVSGAGLSPDAWPRLLVGERAFRQHFLAFYQMEKSASMSGNVSPAEMNSDVASSLIHSRTVMVYPVRTKEG